MNTELTEVLATELRKIEFIEVLNKDVNFSYAKIQGRFIANFTATVLPKDTAITDQELKTMIIDFLKANLTHGYDNIYEVYQINVVRD